MKRLPVALEAVILLVCIILRGHDIGLWKALFRQALETALVPENLRRSFSPLLGVLAQNLPMSVQLSI